MKPVIGLEVHIELSTKTKMFCACSAEHFAKKANTQVCPICLGLPGALPYANSKAIEAVVALGLAFSSRINKFSKFDRKHYFYPDLPKGYQISQYDIPFCVEGFWVSPNGKKVRIRRIHLEEDTGKLIHTDVDGKKVSLIDFNRSGVPLVEIVTEPDFENSEKVLNFLKEVQKIVRYIGISSADMEKGSMRLEANISVAISPKLPDYKVELKNINSFRFLGKAIDSEISRQKDILKDGGLVTQETRGFEESTGRTFPQRSKEEAKDYRYFPEPDIPPINLGENEINKIKNSLPELPMAKARRFENLYALSNSYAEILSSDRLVAEYYENAVKLGKNKGVSPITVADALINKKLNERFSQPGAFIIELLKISSIRFASKDDVEKAVDAVLSKEKKAVADFHKGRGQVVGFLLGIVQKKLDGKGNVTQILEILKTKLH